MAEVFPWGTNAALAGSAPRPATGLYSPGNRLAKAAAEWLVALLLALALLPGLLAIALLVRRDGGPALFVQRREGLHGKPLRVYKFRSMRVEACNPDARSSLDAAGPHVTPLGAMLRRTGLDELPQLFNVLNGSMSLIGPRPHVFAMQVGDALYTDLVPDYHERLHVRPGITGLAQVRGWCGAVETVQHAVCRVASDREYIAGWTPWLDLRIAGQTAGILLRHLLRRAGA